MKLWLGRFAERASKYPSRVTPLLHSAVTPLCAGGAELKSAPTAWSSPCGASAGKHAEASAQMRARSGAGTPSATTGERSSVTLASGGVVVDMRVERDLDARKTKAAARTLVANLVAERLAPQGGGGGQPASDSPAPVPTAAAAATPRTPRNGHAPAATAPTPTADPLSLGAPTPASVPSAYASSRRSLQHFSAAAPAPANAPSAPRGSGAGGAATAATVRSNGALQQPAWRPGGAPARPAATPGSEHKAGDPKNGEHKPPRWLTRDELVEQAEAANRRVQAAEAAAEGARLAAELLQVEVEASEARSAALDESALVAECDAQQQHGAILGVVRRAADPRAKEKGFAR